MQQRAELLEIEDRMHFSHDLKASFTEQEREVDAILGKLRRKFKNDDINAVIHDFYTH